MSRSPIEIALASETKAFKQGIETGVIKPLEDAIKKLRDLGDTDGADKLEASLKDAQRATERLGDETKQTAARIEREFRDAYRSAKRSADDATDSMGKMGQRSAEVGQEVRQNLGEGLANAARGDFEALADTIGDTLGGAAAGIGGLGSAAVAGAAALGLGAVVAVIQNMAAESERTKAIASENFRAMAADGVEAWQSVQSQMQRLTDAYDEHEGEIQKIADLTGVTFEDVAGAWAGIPDKVALVKSAYAEMTSELRGTLGVTRDGAQATIDGWNGIMGPLNSVLDGYDSAEAKARRLADQQQSVWMTAINGAAEATKEVDAFGNILYTLPGDQQVVIQADTGKATQNLDTFKGDLDGIAEKVIQPTIRPRVDTSEWDRWEPQLKRGYVSATALRNGMTWE